HSIGRRLAQYRRLADAPHCHAGRNRGGRDHLLVAAAHGGRFALRTGHRGCRAACGAPVAIVERLVEIVNPLGLHARPSAEFVKLASKFQSHVSLTKDGLDVNGKSIMGVMTLAAEYGSQLTIRAEGDDAEAAATALAELVAKGFSES